MKIIRSITVTAVVLMFALSVFAVPAAAAHDPKDPDHDFIPGGGVTPGDGAVFVHVSGLIDENFSGPGDVFVHANGLIDENFPQI